MGDIYACFYKGEFKSEELLKKRLNIAAPKEW